MTTLRQAIPLGGVLELGWHPITALAIYWLEALALALVAAASCWMVERRTRRAFVRHARRSGSAALARRLVAERSALTQRALRSNHILSFQGGSLLVFGAFFAAVSGILVANGDVSAPDPWEMASGALALAFVVAVGALLDLLVFDVPVTAVDARVSDSLSRWGLFWVLGLVGLFVSVVSNQPARFIVFFAVLKALWEVLALWQRFGRGHQPAAASVGGATP